MKLSEAAAEIQRLIEEVGDIELCQWDDHLWLPAPVKSFRINSVTSLNKWEHLKPITDAEGNLIYVEVG